MYLTFLRVPLDAVTLSTYDVYIKYILRKPVMNQVQKISVDFSTVLKQWLSDETMKTIVQLTKNETDPMICHSDDYCDSNMAMYEAFVINGIDPLETDDGMSQEHTDLWNEAWDLAKKNLFYTESTVK